MIKFFNDTDIAWRLSRPGKNGVTRISAGIKEADGLSPVSMLVPHDGLNEDIVKKTEMTSIETAYTGNSSIYYGKYDNMPNIGTNGTNKNIYFIAKSIKGSHIKDMTKQDVFIFQYTIKKGILFMIMSVKDTCKEFKMTLFNKEQKTDTTFVFDLEKDTVTSSSAPNKDGQGTYKIRSFRPNRPTTAILLAKEDIETMSKDIYENDAYIKYEFNKEDSDSATEQINKIISDGYSAVTLFTDLEDAINDEYGPYDNIVTVLRSGFNQINIILGGRPTPKYIKR